MMDLDSFYEQEFEEYSKDPDNFCNICYEKHNSNSIKIKCGHKYHYECIKDSYKVKHSSINKKKSLRKCPYCRQDGGYLPLLEGYQIDTDIHIKKPKNYKQCNATIMSGEKINTRCTSQCNFLDLSGNLTNFCKRHKNQYNL